MPRERLKVWQQHLLKLRVITGERRVLVAPTDKLPGPLVAPVLLGARVVGASGRGVVLLAELRLLRVPRVLRLPLLLLLGLLGRGLGPAPARGLPA